MSKEIKVVASQVNKLNQVKDDGYGCLIGAEDDETCVIIGFSVFPCDTACDTIEHELLHLQTNLPTGIELLGIVVFGDKYEVDESIIQPVEKVIRRHPLIAYVKIGNAEDMKVFNVVYNRKSQKTFQLIEDQDVWKRFIHIRIKSNIPFICDMSLEGVKEAFALWSKKISVGCLAFANIKSDVYMTFEEQTSEYKTVGDIFEVSSGTDALENKPKKQSSVRKVDILPMDLLLKPVRDIRTQSQERSAPVLQYIKKHYECLKGQLYIDSLCMVGRKMLVDSELYSTLVESVQKSLKLYEECFVQLLSQKMGNFSLPLPYHFLPPNFMHFISLVYPKSSKVEDFYVLPVCLVQMRSLLHQKFCLPQDRPFFRPTNSYIFREDIPKNAPLVNTHEGLGPSGVKGGDFALVQGLYSYHHYMQDRMDDNGWGCAYRSLQTVASWFRWQGYTDKLVPTHKEIQQCLVSIGDKPASFVGSKEWIGSTEVSFCLETLLGVTSRILTASSGEEMASCGSQLLEHFKIHGTPVMIGGGVLAHTILGVHYCSDSGQIKFLILDPHYTGGEDIHVIQSKGWCGWKGLDFWAKGAFYNLCMPLRPVCI